MKSLYISGLVSAASKTTQSTASNASNVFLALVLDTQTNGATIVSEEVYTNKAGVGALAASPMRNLQYVDRFKVLATKKFVMSNANMTNDTGATGGVIQSGITRPFKMFVNLNDTVVTYKGTTASVANITDNSLHLIAYCSNVELAPNLNYNARLRFMG